METAKVDIRKLQLLNDRINQCIDALNQVRLSVHGLSHSASGVPFVSPGINPLQSPLGYGGAGSYAGGAQGFGGQGFGAQGFGGQGFSPFMPGVSHSSPFVTPGFYPGLAQGFSPLQGLSHTSPEEGIGRPGWADPLLAFRIAQTFPYAQYPYPAVVTIF